MFGSLCNLMGLQTTKSCSNHKLRGHPIERSRGGADWEGTVESAKEMNDELAQKLPMLESEVRGLRQLLTEVRANRDELRRDRDRWQRLAERAGPIPSRAEQRAWFCGRASMGTSST
jgi:hypothetical protein